MVDIADTKVGSEGQLDVQLVGGKLVLTFTHNHASGKISLSAEEDVKYFLEKLKVAIPGTFDDVVINIAEAALP